jgi:hypothetical protein
VLAVLAACASSPHVAGSSAASDAVVVLVVQAADAEVYVDDRRLGLVADLGAGIAMSPGAHRLEIRHDRFHARYLELELEPGERRRVEVALAPVLP